MKRKAGLVFIGIGVCCLIGAVVLACYNFAEEQRASTATERYLPKVIETVVSVSEDETPLPPSVENKQDDSAEMTVVDIDGYAFVGCLSMPTLGLELPVLSHTDPDLLQVAPCRYTGSVNTEDLVIGAHNYQSHFGRLAELSVGDEICFLDMNGITTRYRVAVLEVLGPFAVEDLTAGEYPLTLYTCTYGGASRVTVRCDSVN